MEKLIPFTINDLAKVTNHRSGEIKFGEKMLTIPKGIDIAQFLKEKEYELRKEASVTADFYPSKGDEYTVNLKIREKENLLLEINLNVVSRDQAVYICDHWEKKHSDVYSMLIEKLLFDEPNK